MQREESGTEIPRRLKDAMALLDPQSRQVMELWLEGTGSREIAEAVGVSEHAVMVIRGSSLWKMREWIALQPHPEDASFSEITAE